LELLRFVAAAARHPLFQFRLAPAELERERAAVELWVVLGGQGGKMAFTVNVPAPSGVASTLIGGGSLASNSCFVWST
jgi:hypothetical protein